MKYDSLPMPKRGSVYVTNRGDWTMVVQDAWPDGTHSDSSLRKANTPQAWGEFDGWTPTDDGRVPFTEVDLSFAAFSQAGLHTFHAPTFRRSKICQVSGIAVGETYLEAARNMVLEGDVRDWVFMPSPDGWYDLHPDQKHNPPDPPLIGRAGDLVLFDVTVENGGAFGI